MMNHHGLNDSRYSTDQILWDNHRSSVLLGAGKGRENNNEHDDNNDDNDNNNSNDKIVWIDND